jgi:hypothetical protein
VDPRRRGGIEVGRGAGELDGDAWVIKDAMSLATAALRSLSEFCALDLELASFLTPWMYRRFSWIVPVVNALVFTPRSSGKGSTLVHPETTAR